MTGLLLPSPRAICLSSSVVSIAAVAAASSCRRCCREVLGAAPDRRVGPVGSVVGRLGSIRRPKKLYAADRRESTPKTQDVVVDCVVRTLHVVVWPYPRSAGRFPRSGPGRPPSVAGLSTGLGGVVPGLSTGCGSERVSGLAWLTPGSHRSTIGSDRDAGGTEWTSRSRRSRSRWSRRRCRRRCFMPGWTIRGGPGHVWRSGATGSPEPPRIVVAR